MLPVSKDTICYGSADGGKSVHADYPEYNERYVFPHRHHRVRAVSDTTLNCQLIAADADLSGSFIA
jgi:hypothetical protein